jgi:hypothetical protein
LRQKEADLRGEGEGKETIYITEKDEVDGRGGGGRGSFPRSKWGGG